MGTLTHLLNTRTLLTLCIFTLFSSASIAETIIINKSLSGESFTLKEIERIYLGKTTKLESGATVRPCYVVSEEFDKLVDKSKSKFDAYWNKRIFSGTGVKPAMLESKASAYDFAASNEGAVCFIGNDAEAVEGTAKITVN